MSGDLDGASSVDEVPELGNMERSISSFSSISDISDVSLDGFQDFDGLNEYEQITAMMSTGKGILLDGDQFRFAEENNPNNVEESVVSRTSSIASLTPTELRKMKGNLNDKAKQLLFGSKQAQRKSSKLLGITDHELEDAKDDVEKSKEIVIDRTKVSEKAKQLLFGTKRSKKTPKNAKKEPKKNGWKVVRKLTKKQYLLGASAKEIQKAQKEIEIDQKIRKTDHARNANIRKNLAGKAAGKMLGINRGKNKSKEVAILGISDAKLSYVKKSLEVRRTHEQATSRERLKGSKGYNPEIFVKKPNPDFICVVCSLVAHSAVEGHCGHIYCAECSHTVTRCPAEAGEPDFLRSCRKKIDQSPSYYARSKINSYEVKCPRGCNEPPKLRSLKIHLCVTCPLKTSLLTHVEKKDEVQEELDPDAEKSPLNDAPQHTSSQINPGQGGGEVEPNANVPHVNTRIVDKKEALEIVRSSTKGGVLDLSGLEDCEKDGVRELVSAGLKKRAGGGNQKAYKILFGNTPRNSHKGAAKLGLSAREVAKINSNT